MWFFMWPSLLSCVLSVGPVITWWTRHHCVILWNSIIQCASRHINRGAGSKDRFARYFSFRFSSVIILQWSPKLSRCQPWKLRAQNPRPRRNMIFRQETPSGRGPMQAVVWQASSSLWRISQANQNHPQKQPKNQNPLQRDNYDHMEHTYTICSISMRQIATPCRSFPTTNIPN